MKKLRFEKLVPIISLVIVAGVFLSAVMAYAEEPHYVPNEIIVKFKKEVADTLERTIIQKGVAPSQVHLAASLDNLNKKYKVKKFKQIFPNFKKNKEKLEAIKKKNPSLLTKKEKHLLKRLKRAPKDAESPDLSTIYKLKLEEGVSVEEAVAAYSQDPDVEYAELNSRVSIFQTPNDPFYNQQWALNNIGQDYPTYTEFSRGTPDCDIDAPEAWDITTGSDEVVVAVIDTGVDYTHGDIDNNMWFNEAELDGTPGIDDDGNGYIDDARGFDFRNSIDNNGDGDYNDPEDVNDSNPIDDNGHGTHCAGIIAAEGNNELDIAGVCWTAKIMALKAFGKLGSGTVSDIVEAIYYVVANGADITSNSWGSTGVSVTIKQAMDYAYSQGVINVAAAGNYGDAFPGYPAAYESVIAVSASDSDDKKPSWPNFGYWTEVFAPGSYILSLRRGSGTWVKSGTSMACPHVSGTAAAILSAYPEAQADEVRARIAAGADDMDSINPNFKGLLGKGRVNVFNSLTVLPKPCLKIVNVEKDYFVIGETNNLIMHIKNFWQGITGVVATLSTDNPFIGIPNGTATLGDIGMGQTKSNSENPFEIFVVPECPYGTSIDFNLTLTADGDYEETLAFIVKIPFFKDVGAQTGLPLWDSFAATSIEMEDYNNDGFPDVYFVGSDTASLYRNRRDGTFINADEEAGIIGIDPEVAETILFVDIDNDGDRDLFLGCIINNTSGSRLYLNNGNGTFADISGSSGISNVAANSAIAFDYNKDGFVDILASYATGFQVEGELYLLKNNGDNTFTKIKEATLPTGNICIAYGMSGNMVSFDYDNDCDQDILFASEQCGIRFYRNNDDGTFTDVTDDTGMVREDACSVATGDYDRDLDIDVFIGGNFDSGSKLYKNNGDGTFTDVNIEAGNPWIGQRGIVGTAFFDYDNDGDLDLHVTEAGFSTILSNTLYKNNGDGTFTDVTDGLFEWAGPRYSDAAISDYNNDGALDIYAMKGRGGIGVFLENVVGTENNWIKIRLKDLTANRSAYGARVYVRTGEITQLREVHAGAVETMPLHFGVGDATVIDEIEIYWPLSGYTQRLFDVDANQEIAITAIPYVALQSINPNPARRGEILTLRGIGFEEAQGSGFIELPGGIYAEVLSWSTSEIVCRIPDSAAAASDKLYVVTDEGKRSNGLYFAIDVPEVCYGNHFIIDDWNKDINRSFLVNGDGQFNPGERVELQIELENTGLGAARDISATISILAGDEYVTILYPNEIVNFPAIPEGGTGLSSNYFLIEAAPDLPDDCTVTFALDMTDGIVSSWHEEFVVTIAPASVIPGAPMLNPIDDQRVGEWNLLQFTVTATSSAGTPLELFCDWDKERLPQNMQDNLSTVIFTIGFDELTGETIGTFRWIPDSIIGDYYPIAFVARDDLGRCTSQAMTISVLPGSSNILVVDYYNDSDENKNDLLLPNNWESLGGSTKNEVPLHAYGIDKTNSALKITYDCSTEEYYARYISSLKYGLHYLDVSTFDHLSFRVKGEQGGEDFYVQLPFNPRWKNESGPHSNIYLHEPISIAFCDIDADGDYDMFIGYATGVIGLYLNEGNHLSPEWSFERFESDQDGRIDYYDNGHPAFCDIDADGDYDMFIGDSWDKRIRFYRNTGDCYSAEWENESGPHDDIQPGADCKPAFCDIDADGDYDMFIGDFRGDISFYRNTGDRFSPQWTKESGPHDNINVGKWSSPAFCDIDADGDYDMFVDGMLYMHFYRNTGDQFSPEWTEESGAHEGIKWAWSLALCDIDADGDHDMFIGDTDGRIRFYRNSVFETYINVTDKWQQVNIPLSAFPGLNRNYGMAISFMFRNDLSVKQGTIYIDNLQFSKGYKSESTGPVRIDRAAKDLLVNNEVYSIKGVAYQPVPIGSYSPHPDDPASYDRDFQLLANMGCNTIRTWGLPWKEENGGPYINLMSKAHEHGLRVIAGFRMDTTVDYSDPVVRDGVREEFTEFVTAYKDLYQDLGLLPEEYPLLMWAIGNENNYYNSSDGAYYSLCNELAKIAYELETEGAGPDSYPYHPVIIVNGHLFNIGVKEKHAEDLQFNYIDAWGSNVYTKDFNAVEWYGDTRDLFELYSEKSSKPFIITEYGTDAFYTTDQGALTGYVDEGMQVDWVLQNTLDIMEASDICLGGCVMEYSDEWWKDPAGDAMLHDAGGFPSIDFYRLSPDDYTNIEYCGIVEIAPDGTWSEPDGLDDIKERKVYYVLKALYNGNFVGGNDPQGSIQAAINNSFDDTPIIILDGTYTEDLLIENKDGLELIGESKDSTIIYGNVAFKDSRSSIENLSIYYADKGFLPYADCKLLHDSGITAINSGITVKNCIIVSDVIEGQYGKGIQIWNMYDSIDIAPLIEGNEIYNAETAIYLYSHSQGGVIEGEILDNLLQDNTYGIVFRTHQENPVIDGNTINHSLGEGIHGIHLTYEDLYTGRLSNITNSTITGYIEDIYCDEMGY
jgi:subtilisin family serine protease